MIGFIRSLQQLRYKQIVLCVDATTPSTNGPFNLASSIAWKNLRCHGEKQLVAVDATPIAILLGINSIEASDQSVGKTELSNRLSELFQNDRFVNGITIDELQRCLSTGHESQNVAYACKLSPWLVSANWQLDASSKKLPFATNPTHEIAKTEPRASRV